MTLASIARDELPAAIDMLRVYSGAPNVETRQLAAAWVEVGEAIVAGGDVLAAAARFDEVIELLRRPRSERLALLSLREAANELQTNEGMAG